MLGQERQAAPATRVASAASPAIGQPSEGRIIAVGVAGAFLGILLALPVHAFGLACGLIVGAVGGLGTEGPWPERTQTLFAVSWGFWQWLYLAPLVLWARRRWPYVALGIAITGGFGLLLSLLIALSRLAWS
jgi:hypothetical protein